MNKVLHVTVRERKQNGNLVYEGLARLDGGTSFKLTKSKSEETGFSTRSSVTQSANNFAKRYGFEVDFATTNTKKSSTTTATATKKKATARRSKLAQPTSNSSCDTTIL